MGLLAFDGKNSMTKDISLLQSLMQLAAGETFQSILINGAVPDTETSVLPLLLFIASPKEC